MENNATFSIHLNDGAKHTHFKKLWPESHNDVKTVFKTVKKEASMHRKNITITPGNIMGLGRTYVGKF
jgi:hypothetical protein